jgi:hypothetical protein
MLKFTFFSMFKFISPSFKPFQNTFKNVGFEKFNLGIQINFMLLKFPFLIFKIMKDLFLHFFFILSVMILEHVWW